ncbi:MAG: 2'-5' RNA ligase family protein [Phycisphaerales bacterium]
MAVTLFFDRRTTRRIRQLWNTLADHDLSSAVTGPECRPHLTLAVVESPADTERIRAATRATIPQIPSFRLELTSVGAFRGDSGVAFIAPAVTERLVLAHRFLQRNLLEAGIPVAEHYDERQWTPHLTIGIGLDPPRLATALELARHSAVFGPAQATQLGVVRFFPIDEVAVYRLPESSRSEKGASGRVFRRVSP